MKIGDKVRFLSEIGGGRVSGFQGKNIVLVEDEDGFDIPMAISDVVVIESDDYSTSKIVANAMKERTEAEKTPDGMSIKQRLNQSDNAEEEDYDPADKEITFKAPVEERKGGNKLTAYLAFVPIDAKEFTTTSFECYLVNDSNYYMHYTYLISESNAWTLRSIGEVEPNTKCFVEEIQRSELNDMQHVALQMVAYKREKSFILKPAIDVQFRIDPVKFYKFHCFEDNDFFEQPALLFPIVENDEHARPLVVDAKKLKQEMYRKPEEKKQEAEPIVKVQQKGKEEIVVVDLHAHELLDNTNGLSNADILEYQMKKFREVLTEYDNHKGQKIVFIHGKGEGVLRRAIINEITYKYKRYQYQDASFQEYGYGATQITIR